MNKQQVTNHCNTVLSHKYGKKFNKDYVVRLVDIFYVEGNDSKSIKDTNEHYTLLVEGKWSFPKKEVITRVDTKPIGGFVVDWSRNW